MCSALAAALLACGCQSEVDLGGTYHVEANVLSAPCGNDQLAAMPPATLELIPDDAFGFVYARCTDDAAAACETPNPYTDSFPEPIDGGWRGIVTTAGGATTCSLIYTAQTATLHGERLVIDIETHREDIPAAMVSCAPDEAARRGTSMPCAEHERIEATRQ
ncbi:MAG: hypothetical protein HOV81_40325 [Kofleriaceae bacterium]|nr:hypothetical protein [Kofleriaceae bacterium]